MFWAGATEVFCPASSLGDKFISAKLRCTAAEFSFLVALSTAFFLALLLPFIGWEFSFSGGTALAVGGLTVLKLAEFYTARAIPPSAGRVTKSSLRSSAPSTDPAPVPL